MNCDELHRRLDDHLAGRLAPADEREVLAHLQDCAECTSVVATLRSQTASPSIALDVLACTTGSACGRVREELALAFEEAGTIDDALQGHLDDCAACRALADSMQWVHARLPRLAEVAVDADFTADVLMATLPRPSLVHVFALRVRERWNAWLDRPLVAQELAFVCTVALVLLTATPWSPWPQLPQRALDLVQLVPSARAGEAPTPPEDWSLVQAVPPLRYAAQAGDEVRGVIVPRVDRIARDLEWVGTGLGEAGQGVVSGEEASVRDGLREAGCGLWSLWVGLRVPTAPVEGDCARPGVEGGRETGGSR